MGAAVRTGDGPSRRACAASGNEIVDVAESSGVGLGPPPGPLFFWEQVLFSALWAFCDAALVYDMLSSLVLGMGCDVAAIWLGRRYNSRLIIGVRADRCRCLYLKTCDTLQCDPPVASQLAAAGLAGSDPGKPVGLCACGLGPAFVVAVYVSFLNAGSCCAGGLAFRIVALALGRDRVVITGCAIVDAHGLATRKLRSGSFWLWRVVELLYSSFVRCRLA